MLFLLTWVMGSSDSNPVDCILRGVVGACAVSVLCSLMRVYFIVQSGSPQGSRWRTEVQFWALTLILSVVGSRVSSLLVLEFSLRAASAWTVSGLGASSRGLQLLLIQCQFSLGCCFTCLLAFLHQGAPHSTLSLSLAAALSWALAGSVHGLWSHAAKLYPLHSTQRYCGKCMTLLTSGHSVLASLQTALVLAFAVANVASLATVYDHFLSEKDALRFWTPLTLCYAMLVVCIQDNQNRQTPAEALVHTAVLRLGAVFVLMLTVGDWSDVTHVLICFLGEAACLLPSGDLLDLLLKEEEEETTLEKCCHKQSKVKDS
ncbi:transmembrane protein 82-like [Cynoglossus semilaevis]|uniref:transmembrane protein 82-like n=1 Tax=Cynoglossus semilaevis TaxID=244447 RepID=UPI000D624961|nr:transmembrane protein 82-like [Cynoglossus semilaevis]